MKKTYIIPQLSVMEFKAPNLCTMSIYDDETKSASQSLGREAEFDDDEY